ncbi:MAG: hypothetical protein NVV59_02470 [Chitinophagaceae bacterium]|nr:hypothetical protein [Chitinophagaceae bacterium]
MNAYMWSKSIPYANAKGEQTMLYGVGWLLIASISVAMISRIAKAFQDYFLNKVTQKFGATIFTDGLQHAMKLPYHDFEDQRSGETLGILQKVRTDTEKFISTFVNILFPVIVGIIFVAVYAFFKRLAPAIYLFQWDFPANMDFKCAE